MEESEIKQKLRAFLAADDQKGAEDFLIEHFNDLPEELQKDVLFAFYSETLEKKAAEANIVQLQEDGAKAIEALTKLDTDDVSAQ
ncbi:MAG: hypothetical protein JO019_02585 [Candidatus Kaiserbacteria bacterium]|nr:hypothetical protein [Candidatus Kaiserbacteria bacterium]